MREDTGNVVSFKFHQDQRKLVSSEVMPVVQEIVSAKFGEYRLENPNDAKIIAENCLMRPRLVKQPEKHVK